MKTFLLEFLILTVIHGGYSFSVHLEKLSTLYLPYAYTPTPQYVLLEDAAEQLAYDADGRLLYCVGLLILITFHDGYSFSVQLEKLSTLYIPYAYNPTPQYLLDEDVAEQLTYDADGLLLYCAGNNNIHVIDLSDVTNMTILHHTSIAGNVAITDVEFCDGYVFVAIDNKADLENGMVKVYRAYNMVTDQLELLHTITVGSVPDMLYPTHDCMKVLVAIEAEPYLQSGTPRDPQGGVAIIKFSGTPAGNYDLKILNFESFNDRIETLERDGVRFIYRENNTFANDAEPEYIAYNSDETKAYIGLQENNAIAVVDMATEEITHVHGLGFKDWSKSEMDASDRDGENGGSLINQRPWPVYGMYQPDAIKFLRLGGVDYLLTANEGDSKDYSFFSEEDRGDSLTLSSVFEPNATKRVELQEDKNLGRLKVTTENGRNATTGEYDAIYSYGGRSFSIWRADDMSLVYDSGSTIAYQTSVLNPNLFNSNVGSLSAVISSMIDSRSDDKGHETESLEVAEFGDYVVVFVGNERPGTLSLFSIDKTLTAIEPKFEGMFHDIPRTDATWQTLYDNREISMLDPEDIRFVAAEDSPNNKPLLLVSGSVSGTVTVLQINVADTTSPQGTTPVSSATQLKICSIFLVLTGLVKIL